MLNIWGVILYLRLPWITAQAGIGMLNIPGVTHFQVFVLDFKILCDFKHYLVNM